MLMNVKVGLMFGQFNFFSYLCNISLKENAQGFP